MKQEQNNNPNLHGNLLKQKIDQTKSGKMIKRTIEVSDLILNQYGELTGSILDVPILQMQIRSKGLDKPLPFFKSIFASIAKINKQHQFLLFETDMFFITVDYYIDNRLVIRIGDEEMVLDAKTSLKRKNSELVKQTNGLQWKRVFRKQQLTVGALLNFIMEKKMLDYSQITHNGSHYSKQIFNTIQDILIKK